MAVNFPSSPSDGDTHLELGRGWQYNATAGAWESLIRIDSVVDTDDIAELPTATNKFYRLEDAQDNISSFLQAGTGVSLTYDDAANTLTIAVSNTGGFDLANNDTDDLAEGTTNLYYTDARVQTYLGGNVSGSIIPDTNSDGTTGYDLGSSSFRWRDLYLSGSTINLGGVPISASGSGIAVNRVVTETLKIADSVINKTADGKIILPRGSTLIGTTAANDQSDLPEVDLTIAPETLTIQVDAPGSGQDTSWIWTWEQSTLPYARRTITNSNEAKVPLYLQGSYTLNNFAKAIHGSMTQTHSIFLKWVEGAGSDNLVSWATDQGTVQMSHPDINSGNTQDVQRLSISVPSSITLPTLTAPTSVEYDVAFGGAGIYEFSNDAAGDNPNIGPLYRGGTYTFNINAVGHPFYFTTDNGSNFSSGQYVDEYTSGVTNSRTDNGTITFVVPANAPDTLYYQCAYHAPMFGAITIKDLAVETNVDGNYVIYAQHSQEGHKTPIELRPIPSLVNQMCLVYDSSTGRFVPQDLATYVENTPSFENKIRDVAGTASLVNPSGQVIVSTVTIYYDNTYLPLVGNSNGDMAFTSNNNTFYVWDGYGWESTKPADTDSLTEGTTNLYYTEARVNTNFGTKTTTDLSEGTNLYYTDARVQTYLSGGTATTIQTTGDVTVGGNLVVQGTTTSVNSNEVNIGDSIILLNSDETGAPTQNGGIEIERGTATNKTLLWNETDNKWTVGSETFVAGTFEGPITGNVTGSVVGNVTGNLIGDVYSADGLVKVLESSATGTGATFTGNVTGDLTGDVTGDVTGNVTGNVTGTVSDISNHNTDTLSEGSTNLYHTTERVQDTVGEQFVTNGVHTGISFAYDDAGDGAVDATVSLASFDTGDLSEGSNLYFTDERVDDRVAALLTAGVNVAMTYDDAAGSLEIRVPYENIDDRVGAILTAGTGISVTYDDPNATITIANTYTSTTDITEGTNLYYTDERVDDRISNLFVTSTGLTGTYNDAGDSYTIVLDDTAVTPGSYGGATSIPTFTVDQQGRLTAAGSASITTALDIAGDTGTDTVTFASDTLTFYGDTGIATTITNNQVGIAASNVPNSALANSAITITDGTTSQTVSLGDTVTFNDGTDIDVVVSATDTVTISHNVVGANTTVSSASNTFVDSATVTAQGHVTAIGTGSVNFNVSDNYAFKTFTDGVTNAVADSNTDTFTFAKTDQIEVAVTSATDTLTIGHADSGVSAGSYGSATAIPVLTVDAQGHVTAVSTATPDFAQFTISDGSNTQTVVDGDTITFSGTGSEVEVTVGATDTVTIGLPSDVTISNDLTVSGDLIVTGNTTQTGSIVSNSNFTGLSNANTGNATDFGFYGKYVESSTTKYAGIFYDASETNSFRLFADTQTKPTSTVDTTATGYAHASLYANDIILDGAVKGPATFTIDPSNHGDNTGTVVIAGNLTVNGTTTTVNSNTVNVGDNILVLNSDETGTPSQNAGIAVERGTSANVALLWNETDDEWTVTEDGTNYHKLWHAGNDGNGSGLDADTLDGIGSGSFLRSNNADVHTSHIRSDYAVSDFNSVPTGRGISFFNGLFQASNRPPASPSISGHGNYAGGFQTVFYDTNARAQLVFASHGDNSVPALYARTEGWNSNNGWHDWQQVFHDAYHPNADKWTTARTITLGGDLSGSVSIDGSANVTLTATVADDSHNHDGRYYTETESDARYLQLSGGTMSGVITATQSAILRKYVPSWTYQTHDIMYTGFQSTLGDYITVKSAGNGPTNHGILGVADNGIYFGRTNVETGSVQMGNSATAPFDNTTWGYVNATAFYHGSDRVFDDGYHPNADAWTTARTITLAGDLSGSVSIDGSANVTLTAAVANSSHSHNTWELPAEQAGQNVDTYGGGYFWSQDRSTQTNLGTYPGAYSFVTNLGGKRQQGIQLASSYGTGKDIWFRTGTDNASSENGANTWKNWRKLFHDDYHPNADAWTTARTITLGGDLSGSVSIDGSANVTLTGTVTSPARATVQDGAPSSPSTGDFWYESDAGILYVYYDSFWVDTAPSLGTASTPQFGALGVGQSNTTSGRIVATENVHAASFVDYNDNNYYVNPAGYSKIKELDVAADTAQSVYHQAALEVREYNYGGSQTDSYAYAPRIGLHWGGRVASQIAISSNGWINILDNPGTGYENLRADNIYALGDVTAYYSDMRLKTVVGSIDNAIEAVKAIDTFKYRHNETAQQHGFEDDKVHVGVSAQSVEAVLPEVVEHAPFDIESVDGENTSKTGEWYKTVKYDKMVPLLIEAIKEQQIMIDELKQEINKLKGEA